MQRFPPNRDPDFYRRFEADLWVTRLQTPAPFERVLDTGDYPGSEAVKLFFTGVFEPSVEAQNYKSEILATYASGLADMIGRALTAISILVNPPEINPEDLQGTPGPDEPRAEFFKRIRAEAKETAFQEAFIAAAGGRRVYLPALVPADPLPVSDQPLDAGVWPQPSMEGEPAEGPA